jgi:diguanylate cyclase
MTGTVEGDRRERNAMEGRADRSPSIRGPAPGGWARGTLRASVATSTPVALGLTVLGLAASWLLTYLAGGADQVVPHLYYVPILFAAARFGPVAALIVALSAGVLAGPLTYVNVADASVQEAARWLTRAGFFVAIGMLMAALVRPSLPGLGAEIRRLRDEHDLRRGLEAGELFLRYQPIVTASTGRIAGFEALVRWRHPERGELAPAAFLPVAERSELIQEVGAYVLEAACEQAAVWAAVAERAGRPPWFVTINLSGPEVGAPQLVERVRAGTQRSGLAPANLCIEITESALLDDSPAIVEQLTQLQQMGVRVAVDDFGTGYSSLSYLRSFPIDMVKVDRTLTIGLDADPEAQALAGGVVQLCRVLGVAVVAEGIEVCEQGRCVAALDYDLAQGFHYARPMDVDELADVLINHPTERLPRTAELN